MLGKFFILTSKLRFLFLFLSIFFLILAPINKFNILEKISYEIYPYSLEETTDNKEEILSDISEHEGEQFPLDVIDLTKELLTEYNEIKRNPALNIEDFLPGKMRVEEKIFNYREVWSGEYYVIQLHAKYAKYGESVFIKTKDTEWVASLKIGQEIEVVGAPDFSGLYLHIIRDE